MTDALYSNNLITFLLYFVAVAATIGLFFGLSVLVGPKKSNPTKDAAFETGWVSKTDASRPYPIKYYLVAILFVVFDIEVAFLYPWAVSFRDLGGIGLISMTLFLAILAVGLYYAVKKRVLEWK